MRMLFFWLVVSFLAADFASEAFDVEAATVQLTWSAVTTNEDGSAITDLAAYEVCIDPQSIPDSATAGSCTGFLGVPSTQTTASVGFTITDTMTRIYARVRAKDTSGNVSSWSGEASAATPETDTMPPGIPGQVTIIIVITPPN